MKIFKAVFALQLQMASNKRNYIILAVLFLMAAILLQEGTNKYQKTLDNIKAFQKTEQKKVEKYKSITQYGGYGIKFLYIPSPNSIMFNTSGLYNHMESNVDVGERLNIYNSFKGQYLFLERGSFMDFAGILLIFGGVLGLIYGFAGGRKLEFQKHLASLTQNNKLFFPVIISRILIFNLTFTMLALIALIVPLLNGFNLYNLTSLIFLSALIMVNTFFIVLGFIGGLRKKLSSGVLFIVSFFFIFIFLIPWLTNKVISINADTLPPIYQVELEKLTIIMSFEEKFLKEIGIYKGGSVAPENVRKKIDEYIRNENKGIKELEENSKINIKKKIEEKQFISSLTPITFYFSLCNELSSRGLLGFLDFYSFNQGKKDGFFKFYIHKKYDKPSKKIESFIKGDENLFYGRSHIAGSYVLGLITGVFYIIILFIIAQIMHVKRSRPSPHTLGAFDEVYIPLESGQYIAVDADNPDDFSDQIVNVFFGCSKWFNGRLTMDGNNLLNNLTKSFVYLPNIGTIPIELTVKAYIRFVKGILKLNSQDLEKFIKWKKQGNKRIDDLKDIDKAQLLLDVADISNRNIFILDKFFNGIHSKHRSLIMQWVFEKTKGGYIVFDLIPTNGLLGDASFFGIFFLHNGKYIGGSIKETR